MVGDGYFSYTMALFWCTPGSSRYLYWLMDLSYYKNGGGKSMFRPRNHNLTDIADKISAWRATEQPPGGIGVRETGMPCYETPSLALSVAQVRKNAGDLRRYIIVTF